MAENGEEKLLAMARHIAKTLGRNDTMADDILQIFSTFDGRFSREKLSEKDGEEDARVSAALEHSLKLLDRQISQYVAAEHPIWADSADSSAFLDAIDELIATIRDWSPMAGEKSVGACIVRAEDLMQQAMFRVEEEFRSLMERGGESFELRREYGSGEPFDSEDDEDEDEDGGIIRNDEENQIPVAQPITDYNIIIDVLPSVTINDLHEIAKRMVAAGFGKECSHVYSSLRREFLEESLSRLGLKKLSIEEVHKMPWQDLEDEIERWIKAANVSLRILFPSERRLCDRVFFGFSSASDLSFMEVCRGSTIQLLNFADAVAIGSRSPERLFKILDVFETLRDLMPEFESVFSDQYCVVLRNEAITIWKRLGEAIRGIFMELENLIRRDPAKAAVPGGGLHPITRYVMNYLRAACRSCQTLEQVFDENVVPSKGVSSSSSSSLSVQMDWIMELLESNLEAKSKIYKDSALSSVFMMNNGRYIVQKVKDSELLFQNPTFFFFNKLSKPPPPPIHFPISLFSSNLSLISTPKKRFRNRIVTASCISSNNKELLIGNDNSGPEIDIVSVSGEEEEQEKVSELGSENIWKQMKEIVMFTGPATALWICGPLMSLIDTAVIGQGSSIELAALGPGTVVCDYMSYTFMFLSIATSNMVATALARQDKNEVQHHISILLFVGLTCGCLMLLFTKFFGSWVLTAFTGPKNAHLIPAANKYVQIRGLAWPALLVGWVAQSASLGMKDSWGPLKALAVASAVNVVGVIVLCSFMGYGIAGAAWAAMVSQVIAGFMMIEALNKKGYNAYSISVPSPDELLTVLGLAAPVFLTMMSKVAFYSLLIYFATSMGTYTMAAHQVMIQTFVMCTVWGEPLSQTAQSFMPELIYGAKRSLEKARMLLKSLVIIGVILGLLLGIVGTSVPWLFPKIFTHDQNVIQEMHKVLIPFFMALAVTPPTISLEGTLLAGRDLKFLSLSMSGCFAAGALLLLLVTSRGYGLPGCWFGLVGFQWARFFLSLRRLLSPNGILYSEDLGQCQMEKLRAV